MIYLVEDRRDRIVNYLPEDLKSSPFLDIEKNLNIAKYHVDQFIDSLNSTAVIILHKSYIFDEDSSVTMDYIREKVKSKKIPFVYFSGGSGSWAVDDFEASINSNTMYKNLPDFVKLYQEDDSANLSLLTNGNMYLLVELKKMQIKVSQDLIANEKDDIVKLIKKTKVNINSYLSSKELLGDKESLVDWLNKNVKNLNANFSVKIILEQIQKMIAKYEND